MSGARPKVSARRSSNSSLDADTGALCRHVDSEDRLVNTAQQNQDGLELSLAYQQSGTVQDINYSGHVEGRNNVLLQPGANCEMTFNSPLVQNITHVTHPDGTKETHGNDVDFPLPDVHDDKTSVAGIPTHHLPNTARPPQFPSTKQLEWLKCHLGRLYKTKLGEFQPLPWFDDLHLQLKDVYTNLQIVRKDRADRDLPFRRSGVEGTLSKSIDCSSGTYTREDDDSELIRIEQIFDVDRNGDIPRVENPREVGEDKIEKPKRIRIEGPPGIGKSIQCRKLACDWSIGLFQQFDFTFLLQMRYFSGDVKDAVFDQLLPEDTDINREHLWSYLTQTTIQPKVLVILDGLDELKTQVRQTSDVIKLIQQRVMTDATVVVTSRPHECTADLKYCPLHCNIRGYTKVNSQEYVHKYFKERPELANNLCVRMARDEKLVELTTNPLNTMLLCIVWEDNDGSLPSTITELFSRLVLCIVKRYCSRNGIAITGTTIPESVYDQLVEMGRVAWKGLLRNEVNFDEADFKSIDRDRNLFRIGFLTKDLGASRIEGSFVWSFLHKTFQEYFAAVFLSMNTCIPDSCCGSVPTGTFEFIPHRLHLVEPRVRRVQVNASLLGSSPTFRDLVLESFRNDHLHQVCLFLVGILKTNAQTVFEYFCSHLQTMRSSGDNDTQEEYKTLFRLCIQCLIESENGPDLVRVLPPCFPKAVDVSSYFADVYDDTWRLGLILILNAESPGVTRVDIDLSTHQMDNELTEAFIRSRFVSHLSITKFEADDISVISLDTEQEFVPLLTVLERAQSLRVFFARIVRLTTRDKDFRLMTRLFHTMSHGTPLSSIILKLHMDSEEPRYRNIASTGKLRLPVHLLASSSVLTTFKLWIYGTLERHVSSDYYFVEGDFDSEGLDDFVYDRVDDQAFNESIRRLLCESKHIQSFTLQVVYRCTVFEHAVDLPTVLADVISSTEVLHHMLLHFSFYQKNRERLFTCAELPRLHVFSIIEVLAHNGTLRTFQLFIDDNVLIPIRKPLHLFSLGCKNTPVNDIRRLGNVMGPCSGEGAHGDDVGAISGLQADVDRLTVSNGRGEREISTIESLVGNIGADLGASTEEVTANANEGPSRTCQDRNSQSRRGSPHADTDQDRLWPSIASVFRSNTVLHELNLTFKYCLTESHESVQRMADAILALSGNRTLRTVKLAVILYRLKTHLRWTAKISGISNLDEVFCALGNVVTTNTSLTCLHFRKADDPQRRTRRTGMKIYDDEEWYVTVSKHALELLAAAIQRNMVLREFSISGFSCEDEGVKELVDEMVSSARDDLNVTLSINRPEFL